MGIAEGMKSITENIISSYNTRVTALDDLVADTRKTLADARKTLKDFSSDRKKMSEEQAKELANHGTIRNERGDTGGRADRNISRP